MGARIDVLVLAAVSRGAAPAHVLQRRLGGRPSPWAALAALERRRLVRRVDGVYRLTRRGRELFRAERELALLVARSG